MLAVPSLIPRPSHVFQCMREKSERPVGSGDVIGRGLRHGYVSPPTRPHNERGHASHVTYCMGEWAEIRNCAVYVEKHGRSGYKARLYPLP